MNTVDYHSIEMVIHVFDEKSGTHSGERKIETGVGLSRDELDGLFMRWAGVKLTRFLSCLTLSYTRKRLLESSNVLAGPLQPRPAGPDRPVPYENRCRLRLLTSAQGQGLGLTITYGLYPSPFGDCLLAMGDGQICYLSFVDGGGWQLHVEELRRKWPQARILADEGGAGSHMVEQIFAPAGLDLPDSPEPLPLLLKGTDFQLRVWRALLALPRGAIISYEDLAVRLGRPTACRAVAGAVAANPVAYLIPCHRVIRKSGEIHRYRWGSSRKKAMLGMEACRL